MKEWKQSATAECSNRIFLLMSTKSVQSFTLCLKKMNIVIASVCSHFSLFPSLLFCLSVCACVCLSRSLFCPLSLFLPLYSSTIEKCTARVTLIVVVRLAFVVQPNEMFVLCFVFFVSTRHQTEKLDLLGFLTFRMSSSFHRVNCA